jgi:hypothetical protein
MCQRGGELDLQPALLGVDADRLVPKRLVGLAVGGEEPAFRLPAFPPLLLGQPCVLEVMTGAQQPSAAPHDRDLPLFDPALNVGETGLEMLEPPLLGGPLVAAGIPAGLPAPPTGRNRQPAADRLGRPLEAGLLVEQVPPAPFPLVLRRAGDRPRPPRRRYRREVALPTGPLAVLDVPDPAAVREIPPGELPEVFTDRPEDVFVLVGRAQPGPDPRWRRDHERVGQRTMRTAAGAGRHDDACLSPRADSQAVSPNRLEARVSARLSKLQDHAGSPRKHLNCSRPLVRSQRTSAARARPRRCRHHARGPVDSGYPQGHLTATVA